jgi:hypothetical protein
LDQIHDEPGSFTTINHTSFPGRGGLEVSSLAFSPRNGTLYLLEKGIPRVDIIKAINLNRPIPIADGSTGDVITLDAAIDSSFPNGRRMGGGTAPNRNQVNVNSVLISLIVAGNPAAGLAKGVEVNDKDYLDRFPFLAPAHQGLFQGHGSTNLPTVPNIPIP